LEEDVGHGRASRVLVVGPSCVSEANNLNSRLDLLDCDLLCLEVALGVSCSLLELAVGKAKVRSQPKVPEDLSGSIEVRTGWSLAEASEEVDVEGNLRARSFRDGEEQAGDAEVGLPVLGRAVLVDIGE